MQKDSLFTANFLLLCGIVFLIVCNVAVYYSLHVYLQGIGFTGSRSGVVISLYSMAGMTMYATLSSLIRTDNAFKSMALGLGLMLTSGCGFLFVESFWGLAVLRLMQGMGGFFLFAPCTVLLVSIIPKGKEGSAFSLYSAALLLPYSLLPALSDVLMPHVGSPTWLYAGAACFMIPTSLAVLHLRRSLAPSNTDAQPAPRPSTRESFANLKNPTIMATLLTNLFYFMIFTGVFFLFQDYALSRGIENSGIYFTIQMGVMVTIRLGANKLFDTISPKILITCAMVITSASLGALMLLDSPSMLIPLAILFGLGMGLCTPPLNSLLYQAGNPKFRGFNANMMVLTIHAGSFLGPLIGSSMVEITGYNAFLTTSAIVTFSVGIIFLIFVPVPERTR